jgi:hypothetical protein
VAVPGVTLPAGQYLFRLPTKIASGERHVMQVLSADGSNSYAMFFGISANRTDYPTKPEVRFMETAAVMPPAVKDLVVSRRQSGVRIHLSEGASASAGERYWANRS